MKYLVVKKWFLTLGLIALIGAIFPISASASAYSFQEITNPNDVTFTQLLGINNAGVIAGYYGSGATGHPNQGFTLVLPNTFTSENFPGSVQTQVIGINASGNTAGFYIDAAGFTHGFLKAGGTFTTIDQPGTVFNQLLGLNNASPNIAAGYSSTDPTGATIQQAYTYQGGTFTSLAAFFPAGTQNNQATDVNNAGVVSGFYFDAALNNHGFLLNGATFSPLNVPGSNFTQALGLNNLGDVVGTYIDAANVMHGFVYDGTTFHTVDDPLGVGSTTINGINDLGQIVGFFVDAHDNTIGFVGTPVPVPSAFLLFGSGIVGLGWWRRRDRQAS